MYRIVHCIKGDRQYYIVQEKFIWWWNTKYAFHSAGPDGAGSEEPIEFSTIKEAEDYIVSLKAPIQTVVKVID